MGEIMPLYKSDIKKLLEDNKRESLNYISKGVNKIEKELGDKCYTLAGSLFNKIEGYAIEYGVNVYDPEVYSELKSLEGKIPKIDVLHKKPEEIAKEVLTELKIVSKWERQYDEDLSSGNAPHDSIVEGLKMLYLFVLNPFTSSQSIKSEKLMKEVQDIYDKYVTEFLTQEYIFRFKYEQGVKKNQEYPKHFLERNFRIHTDATKLLEFGFSFNKKYISKLDYKNFFWHFMNSEVLVVPGFLVYKTELINNFLRENNLLSAKDNIDLLHHQLDSLLEKGKKPPIFRSNKALYNTLEKSGLEGILNQVLRVVNIEEELKKENAENFLEEHPAALLLGMARLLNVDKTLTELEDVYSAMETKKDLDEQYKGLKKYKETHRNINSEQKKTLEKLLSGIGATKREAQEKIINFMASTPYE